VRITPPLLLFLVLWISGSAFPQSRPVGLNCDLVKPPADAGEEQNHGATMRIFPGAKAIGPTYSGCQVLFAPDGQEWVTVALTEVVNGDPTRVWSEYESDPKRMQCLCKHGKVVRGERDTCPVLDSILVKSMPPGCVRAIGDLVAKSGLGAKWPKECEYD
jgi:hypothetical protein